MRCGTAGRSDAAHTPGCVRLWSVLPRGHFRPEGKAVCQTGSLTQHWRAQAAVLETVIYALAACAGQGKDQERRLAHHAEVGTRGAAQFLSPLRVAPGARVGTLQQVVGHAVYRRFKIRTGKKAEYLGQKF